MTHRMSHTYSNSDFWFIRLTPKLETPLSLNELYSLFQPHASHFVISQEISARKKLHYHVVIQFAPLLNRKQIRELFDSFGLPSGNSGRSMSQVECLDTSVTYVLKDGKYVFFGFAESYIKDKYGQSYAKVDFSSELKLLEDNFRDRGLTGYAQVLELIDSRITLSLKCNRSYNKPSLQSWALRLLHETSPYERKLFSASIANTISLSEQYEQSSREYYASQQTPFQFPLDS